MPPDSSGDPEIDAFEYRIRCLGKTGLGWQEDSLFLQGVGCLAKIQNNGGETLRLD